MAFTKALYYPWIDIHNEDWLKTTALYWDEISTIVPDSIRNPYKSRTTMELFDNEILKPVYIDRKNIDVEEASQEMLSLIRDPRWVEMLELRHPEEILINANKMSHKLRWELNDGKISSKLDEYLSVKGTKREGPWLKVSGEIGLAYMTILATKIAESKNAGLLTDNSSSEYLSSKARLVRNEDGNGAVRKRKGVDSSKEALLSQMVLANLNIDPEISIKKVINFKVKYKDELGKARNCIGKLAEEIGDGKTAEAIRQKLSDIYKNEVEPAINDLQKALKSSRIKAVSQGFMKIAVISTGATALLPNIGLSIPQALLASSFVSLIGSKIEYDGNRKEILDKNPYTYFLQMKKELSRKPI